MLPSPSMAKPSIYHGTFVYCSTKTALSIRSGHMCVDVGGKITHFFDATGDADSVGAVAERAGWGSDCDFDLVEASGNEFFFPGFVDTHIHAPQYPNAGLFGSASLLDWLTTYTYPLESSLSSLPKAAQVYSTCVAHTIAHGTTTAAYYASIHVEATKLLAGICLKRGQRALIGRACMDSPHELVGYYRDEGVAEAVSANKEIVDFVRGVDPGGDRIVPVLTPRSAVSCSGGLLRAIGKQSREEGVMVQTHVAENLDEVRIVKGKWPEAESYAAVYDSCGLLGEGTILAHGVHLSKEERGLIARRGAKVAHCPVSNSALVSGLCPVRSLLDDGIVVGLGTDISGGYSPSILEAVRHACLVSRLVAFGSNDEDAKLSVEEALWLATRGGAHVVGWGDRIGAFEVGMQWDAQLIGLDVLDQPEIDEGGGLTAMEVKAGIGNVKIFTWQNLEEWVQKWVYGGDDRNTRMVWVCGKLIHSIQ